MTLCADAGTGSQDKELLWLFHWCLFFVFPFVFPYDNWRKGFHCCLLLPWQLPWVMTGQSEWNTMFKTNWSHTAIEYLLSRLGDSISWSKRRCDLYRNTPLPCRFAIFEHQWSSQLLTGNNLLKVESNTSSLKLLKCILKEKDLSVKFSCSQ